MRYALLILAGLYAWRVYKAGGNYTVMDVITADATQVAAAATGKSIMRTSYNGIEALKKREKFSAKSYPDATGRSIGFGHFILPHERFAEPISVELATQLLQNDLRIAENAVNGAVKVPISQAQFDALVSFVYNIGVSAFRGSTALKRLNAGDYAGAREAMALFNKSRDKNGVLQYNASLASRRASEQAQFV